MANPMAGSMTEDDQALSNINPLALQNNRLVMSRFRIICALFAGATVGILGVEGLSGFGIYFVQHFLTSLVLVSRVGINPDLYFQKGWNSVLTGQILGSETFMTYLLLWTVFFNVCHIF